MPITNEIDFVKSQLMLEWHGIKTTFVEKGFWNEQAIKCFIHDDPSFVEKWYKVPFPEELNEENNL